jgi:hypothetical protein
MSKMPKLTKIKDDNHFIRDKAQFQDKSKPIQQILRPSTSYELYEPGAGLGRIEYLLFLTPET